MMAYPSRPTSMFAPGTSAASSLRQPSGHHNISQQQSTALASRIAAKQAELDNLKQLRDMSASLAVQMQTLESKLGTLRDGTEGLFMNHGPGCRIPKAIEDQIATNFYCSYVLAVACVLANWDNVLRAIGMASSKFSLLVLRKLAISFGIHLVLRFTDSVFPRYSKCCTYKGDSRAGIGGWTERWHLRLSYASHVGPNTGSATGRFEQAMNMTNFIFYNCSYLWSNHWTYCEASTNPTICRAFRSRWRRWPDRHRVYMPVHSPPQRAFPWLYFTTTFRQHVLYSPTCQMWGSYSLDVSYFT